MLAMSQFALSEATHIAKGSVVPPSGPPCPPPSPPLIDVAPPSLAAMVASPAAPASFAPIMPPEDVLELLGAGLPVLVGAGDSPDELPVSWPPPPWLGPPLL